MFWKYNFDQFKNSKIQILNVYHIFTIQIYHFGREICIYRIYHTYRVSWEPCDSRKFPGALRFLGLGAGHRHGSCSGTLPQGHLEILEDFWGWKTRTRGNQHQHQSIEIRVGNLIDFTSFLISPVVLMGGKLGVGLFKHFWFSPGTLGKSSNLTI